jgi:hypothetical protein
VRQYFLYDRLRTSEFCSSPRRHGGVVGAPYNVRVEYCDQTVDIACAQGSEERFYGLSLFSQTSTGPRSGAPYTSARAARELPGCSRGAPHNGSNFVECHPEHVVQHECHALGRREPFENHEQCKTYGFGQQSFLLGISSFSDGDDGIAGSGVDRVFAP